MSEQNIVNVMVIPDVPKVLPGEQLYVYVPKASFTSPGIIAYNDTQFEINGNFLRIRDDYVSPGVTQNFVSKQLAGYRQITAADNTPTFRTNAYTYVNNGVNGYRMSLQAIKELNTKIMSVDSINDADFNKLSVGDFIYSKD